MRHLFGNADERRMRTMVKKTTVTAKTSVRRVGNYHKVTNRISNGKSTRTNTKFVKSR